MVARSSASPGECKSWRAPPVLLPESQSHAFPVRVLARADFRPLQRLPACVHRTRETCRPCASFRGAQGDGRSQSVKTIWRELYGAHNSMSEMLSYLLAQARRQPLDTLRFAAGEVWRRGRLRWKDSLHHNLPKFSTGFEGINFAAFLPSVDPEQNEDQQRVRDLPFSERVISTAERACRHEFEIFGEWISLGPEIDWHCDWQTVYRWPLERVAGVSVLDSQAAAPPGTDIKRPW